MFYWSYGIERKENSLERDRPFTGHAVYEGKDQTGVNELDFLIYHYIVILSRHANYVYRVLIVYPLVSNNGGRQTQSCV